MEGETCPMTPGLTVPTTDQAVVGPGFPRGVANLLFDQFFPKTATVKINSLHSCYFPQYSTLDFSGGKRHLEGLAAALRRNSRDNLVVVATTDYGYVEMTQNLYETSFERYVTQRAHRSTKD